MRGTSRVSRAISKSSGKLSGDSNGVELTSRSGTRNVASRSVADEYFYLKIRAICKRLLNLLNFLDCAARGTVTLMYVRSTPLLKAAMDELLGRCNAAS